MVLALVILFWVAAVVFVAACVARVRMYARTPIHLRWELYPVPHEDPDKVAHGGSYFEDVNWWERPRRKNLLGEVAAMVPEIVFLKGLWEFNRGLWVRSCPFHLGLYLLCASGGLLLLAAVLSLLWPGFEAKVVGRAFHWLYSTGGGAGLVLALVGAVGLLVRRLTDETLRVYTSGWDIFNLLFFIVTFALLGVAHLVGGAGYQGPLAFLMGVLSFRTDMAVPPLFGVAVALLALLVAYVPITHMSHFIGKYFTYHSVRWNDEPNQPGGAIERRIALVSSLGPEERARLCGRVRLLERT